LVLTRALTFYPFPLRESPSHVFSFLADHPANPVARDPKRRRKILPLRQRELGEIVLRLREQEKVAAGRMRVVG
jgi:hypothetical protein